MAANVLKFLRPWKVKNGVRNFEDIPGPSRFPVIGSMWKYFPGIGNYSVTKLHETSSVRRREFGPLVREKFGPVELLNVYDPSDVEAVFKQEGKYPARKSHSALALYRSRNPDKYNNAGLLATNGEEWWRIRSELQKPLSKLSCVRAYLPRMNEVVDDFLARAPSCDNLENLLSRLALEMVGVVFLDNRLGCLDENPPPGSLAPKVITAAYASLDCVMKTELSFPWWQWFATPTFRKLCSAQDYLYEVATDFVKTKEVEMKTSSYDPQNSSVLEEYLRNSSLDRKDVVSMISDALFAGIDTTAFSSSFLLYLVATHPEVQEKLFVESQAILPQRDSSLDDPAILSRIPYTRAVVKESMRLFPISVGIGRLTTKEMLSSGDECMKLGGYPVPPGVVIVTQNMDMSRNEEFFEKAAEFCPERWLAGKMKEEGGGKCWKKPHPFVSLPFGHGPRACIGRRLAEQELYLILMKLVRRFRISWTSGKMDCVTRLINAPSVPLAFKFEGRDV